MTEELNTEIEIVPAATPVDATVVNPVPAATPVDVTPVDTSVEPTETPAVDSIIEKTLKEISSKASNKSFIIIENEIGKEEVKVIAINSSPERTSKLINIAQNISTDELARETTKLRDKLAKVSSVFLDEAATNQNDPVETPEAEILPPEAV